MKSQKGITITSLIVYVLGLAVVLSIITTISTYFYTNILTVEGNTKKYKDYIRFNSYFLQEINNRDNQVKKCESKTIVFSNGNQYNIQNGKIYFNSIEICSHINEKTSGFEMYTDEVNGKKIIKVNFDDIISEYTLEER